MRVIVPFVGGPMDGLSAEFDSPPESHLAPKSPGNPTETDYLLYLFDVGGGLSLVVYVSTEVSPESALTALTSRLGTCSRKTKIIRLGPSTEVDPAVA